MCVRVRVCVGVGMGVCVGVWACVRVRAINNCRYVSDFSSPRRNHPSVFLIFSFSYFLR